jgi:hypothetical protein
MAAIGALLVVGLWRQRRLLHERRTVRWGVALAAVSVLAVLGAWSQTHLASLERILLDLQPVLLGWAVLFWLPLDEPQTGERDAAEIGAERGAGPPHERLTAAGLVVASAAIIAVAHALTMGGFILINDEVGYILQASWMGRPHASWAIEPALREFFTFRQFGYTNGRLFSEYPPGWPAVLWVFSALGLRWWSGVAVGAACVALVYLLGRRVHSPRAGAVAAIFLGTQPWFLMAAAGYMSHTFTMLCALGGAVALLGAARPEGTASWRPPLCALAGFALAAGVAARPLTGVAMSVAVFGWVVLRERAPPRVAADAAAWAGVGALLPIAATLYFNAQTTGSALTFGYAAVHGHLHDLGFGRRGFMVYDRATLAPVPFAANFTVRAAISSLSRAIASANIGYLAIGLFAPFLLVAVRQGYRLRWWTLLPFAALPAVYFFYFFSAQRFYGELLPFIAVGVAVVLLHVAQRRPRLAVALGAALLAGNIVYALPWRVRRHRLDTPWLAHPYTVDRRAVLGMFAQVETLRRAHPRLLVFVSDSGAGRYFTPALERLLFYDDGGLDGPVLVVRDRGAHDSLLVDRFPDRWPVRVSWRGTAPVVITELARSGGRRSGVAGNR